MHPAVYIPIGVPLQFARTYNLETMGKKKKEEGYLCKFRAVPHIQLQINSF